MEKILEWKKHLEAATRHPRGLKAYCREQGIGNSNFHYWKKKLGGEAKPAAAKFAAVQIVAAPKILPDPKWLAEFLKAYEGSSR